jgi:CMP-N,N'-diacetyllegionaminic acid synthase
MAVVAIIPARGGSKGISKKNLVGVGGRPLVEHSIAHALSCNAIDRVVVSTDCEEIRAVAESAGAEVPFMRPSYLAEDDVLDWPVFSHACDALRLSSSDLLVHLRPTSPYRRLSWTSEAISLLSNNLAATSVRSVHKVLEHPYRTFFREEKGGFLKPFVTSIDRPYEARRQDWASAYFYNCVVDVTRVSTVTGAKSMTGERIMPFVMDKKDVHDIDSYEDLQLMRNEWPQLEKDVI